MRRIFMIISLAAVLTPPLLAEEMLDLRSADVEKIELLERLHLRAQDQAEAHKYRDAMQTYREILLEEPDDEVAYANIGQLYLLFGERSAASEAFQNALSINPDNETAFRGLISLREPDDSSYR